MEDDDISHPYDNSHRAFLQAFMARGTMTFNQARPILAAIFTAHDQDEYRSGNREEEPIATRLGEVSRDDFDSYVSAVSSAISPFDMEIRATTHQVTKERVYSLINTTSDAMTQLATLRSAEEMAFVRRVIDAMFDQYNTPRMEVLCIDGMQANKLRAAPPRSSISNNNNNEDAENDNGESQTQTQALKGLKSSEVEQVLRGLVDEGWFERSRAGFYSLSPRALTELRQWLVDAYNEADAGDGEWQRVKFCEACREIVTVGQRCAERDCCARLHDICEDAFWRTRRERKCPRCSAEWTGKHYVGERAVTETESYQRGRRRSGKSGGRSSLADSIMDAEEGEDEE
ncbi:Nse1 non-SMC component of SMC5-6 complex-domain-containing protein [Daldinia eschscholtzii]|nr:Nse1 non-SMC component of SMC5-6 complex-domain-containing protein [Daldinia eschscholtzii]